MNTEIPLICQECLSCLHGKPYFALNIQNESSSSSFGHPITTEEWQLISQVYNELTSYDQPIEINLSIDGKNFK